MANNQRNMGRFHLRYARRMLTAASGRFVRDERGTIMVMTIVFALPLAMFLFVTYNTGIGLTTRMRAQCVADAASYSAALWHARFLNYCAYTRRQITANYATIALCTAYESSLKMYHNIYDAQNLYLTFYTDNGDITEFMQGPYNMLNGMQVFQDNETVNPVKNIRKGCDVMNKCLSVSQSAMYYTVCLDTKSAVMRKVVEEANRQTAAEQSGAEFTLNALSYSSLLFSPSVSGLLEQKAITRDQVEHYRDFFTDGKFYPTNFLPGLGRGMFGADYSHYGDSAKFLFTDWVWVMSFGVDIPSDGRRYTSDEYVIGWYIIYWIKIDTPWGPIIFTGGLPIFGAPAHARYDANRFEDTKVYQIASGASGGRLEPSSLAIVEAVHSAIPWYPHMGLLPTDLVPGAKVRAFSRAKAYFRGVNENLEGGSRVYQKPHTSYPYWGAKLAPLSEDTGAQMVLFPFKRSLLSPAPNY